VLTAVGLVVFGTAVGAQTYGSGMTVSDSHPAPGSQVTVRATGFVPNGSANVLFDSVPIASTTTDANGIASAAITIPVSADAGQHVLTVAYRGGRGRVQRFSKSVTVETGGMAFIHSDADSPGSVVIVALLIVGLVAAGVTARRVRAEHR
jgi:hypothetical protein